VKLSGGEYIALERLEAIYKSCNLVANLCVYGHPDARQPMAVIIPNETHLRHALKQGAVQGVDADASLHVLCGRSEVRKLILENCNALGKKNGFKPLELLETVVLTDDEWTPESGLVTAAQKLQRKKILEAYKDEIKVRINPILSSSVLTAFAESVPLLSVKMDLFSWTPVAFLSSSFPSLIRISPCNTLRRTMAII